MIRMIPSGAVHTGGLWQLCLHRPPRPQCEDPHHHFLTIRHVGWLLASVQASLVLAVLVLTYCLYVVQDWLDMLNHDQA